MRVLEQFFIPIFIGLFEMTGIMAYGGIVTWDASPVMTGAQDGSGTWGFSASNTNWWNGVTSTSWNNDPADLAVLGVNTAAAVTITITNNIIAGGILYSNVGAGVYSLAAANGATLSVGGPSPIIQLSGPDGVHFINPSVIATGGLSVLSLTTNTAPFLRFGAANNNIVGSLFVGTPGNDNYATPTSLYVDFNNGSLGNVLNNTTNVTVFSNATLRISGQNGSAYNLAFPRKITISGDGQKGTRGAWVITGNAGGTFNANVVLASDSTIMTSSGGGGAYTYTINGAISGAGNLRLVNDTTYTTTPTLVLPGGPHTYNGINTTIGGNLTVQLTGGNNRLPTNTSLTLGIGSVAPGATGTGYGRLVLGGSGGAINQTLVGLATGFTNSLVVGGNGSANSTLTLNAAASNLFSGTLGGGASPDNRVALVKDGNGQLTLAGANQCAGGFTVNSGTLMFGDGITDQALSGIITNHATVVFNVASNAVRTELITGTGSLTKIGAGTLTFDGTNSSAGPLTIEDGTLSGSGVIAGPVAVHAGGIFSPGDGLGIFTINNALMLAGTSFLELDKIALTNDSVRGLSSVTFGGTLVVSNLAGPYAVGDAFKFFYASSYSGKFTNIVPALPGPGRAWDTSTLTNDGTLRVTTNSTPNHPPIWTINPLTKPQAATNVSYADSLAGQAADPDVGDTLSFSKLTGPAWLNVAANGGLTGVPGASDLGTNTFTVRVTDSGGLSNDATLLISVIADLNALIQLASPDGSLVLNFEVSDFDGSVDCPVYSVIRNGQPILAKSKLGLTFGGNAWRDNVAVSARTSSAHDSNWTNVSGERSLVRDHYNEMVVSMKETVAPARVVQFVFRAYDEGVAWSYTIPSQPGLTVASALTEQTEFRFTGNHTAWSVTSAQGGYSTTTVDNLSNGNERPLTVQMATNLFLALGEARLVDFARMKFYQASAANSVVSSLSSSVTSTLPLRAPWRFVMAAESPGRLLENNDFLLNLNDPCEITNTAWIKPGKVLREVTLITTGGVACVDFAVKHKLQYVEFDAGWYGPENTTSTATNVNVDPARSPGPLDLQQVINYGNSNGVGVILYVNKVALDNQIDILPALYRSWGVKGMKFGFVSVGSQADTQWLHDSIRKCATNEILVDVHDEYRMTGYSRTYPNFLTAEGVRGDEETPSATQDIITLFTRMIAGPADHTMCFYESRVTNNWNHAYQLAKAVCFFSPWQFIHWYDRPTNSPGYVPGGNTMISEDPALEFHDHLPTVWDDTKVLQGSIGQYAVIGRRSGEDWYIGAMNASTARTLTAALDFLPPGKSYVAHRFAHDPAATNRTHIRVTRSLVDSTTTLSSTLAASSGEAVRLTPVRPPVFQNITLLPDGRVKLQFSGEPNQPFSLRASSNSVLPAANWSVLTNAVFDANPAYFEDASAPATARRFFLLSTP